VTSGCSNLPAQRSPHGRRSSCATCSPAGQQAGVIDSYLGRRLPGLVGALGVEAFGVDAFTQIGGPGEPAYKTVRLAWPATRAGAAAVGLAEDDLRCVDRAFANSTIMVGVTIFAPWGQLPP
jgi:hypothetical protein